MDLEHDNSGNELNYDELVYVTASNADDRLVETWVIDADKLSGILPDHISYICPVKLSGGCRSVPGIAVFCRRKPFPRIKLWKKAFSEVGWGLMICFGFSCRTSSVSELLCS